ncbi:MAG: large extracellular alpha-helical protein [Actinobacteria bacterium]|nr:large extracellular alpha-helical protein [Actinomycetota bacterium]
MTDRRMFRLAGDSARVLIGAVVAAGLVTATLTAVVMPWPSLAQAPVSVTATPAPSDTVAVCTGSPLALGRDAQQATQLTSAADQAVTAGVASDATTAAQSALTATSVSGSVGPAVLTAPPEGGTLADLAAAGSATVTSTDLAGFTASECRTPLMESWLVGGATTTGSADLVVLANPGNVAATVQLTVYGSTGAQVPPSGANLVIAPRTQRVVPLSGLLFGESSPVVHVTASGGPIAASMQASITRTLVTGGVDQFGSIATAETTQVIPGVTVTAPTGDAGAAQPSTILRLLAPSDSTTATITVSGADGAAGWTQQIPLTAGLPAEVALSSLAAGAYTVRIDAQAPVVAAVWQTTGFAAGADFAWYTAAPEIAGANLVAVPQGPGPSLSLANTGTADASVTLEPVAGGAAPVTVVVPVGRTVGVPVTAGSVYRLTSSSPIHGMVSFSAADALAGFPLQPAAAAAATIRVYP